MREGGLYGVVMHWFLVGRRWEVDAGCKEWGAVLGYRERVLRTSVKTVSAVGGPPAERLASTSRTPDRDAVVSREGGGGSRVYWDGVPFFSLPPRHIMLHISLKRAMKVKIVDLGRVCDGSSKHYV